MTARRSITFLLVLLPLIAGFAHGGEPSREERAAGTNDRTRREATIARDTGADSIHTDKSGTVDEAATADEAGAPEGADPADETSPTDEASPESEAEPGNEAAPEEGSRETGTVTILAGPRPCSGEECYEVAVACPALGEPERARLKIGRPAKGEIRGTILFMTGLGGRQLWENFGSGARSALKKLKKAGFRTVQIAWDRGWLIGARGGREGPEKLACRPATLARWIHDRPNRNGAAPGPEETAPQADPGIATEEGQAFCATGNSAGAAQISYGLTAYGLDEIYDTVILTGGPPLSRLDLACIRDDTPGNYYFPLAGRRLMDQSFGQPSDGSGPCSRSDPSIREALRRHSQVLAAGDFDYPDTEVWFLFGAKDDSSAVPQGMLFYDKLKESGSPRVFLETVPKTPHETPSTRKGATKIRKILLKECVPHRSGAR